MRFELSKQGYRFSATNKKILGWSSVGFHGSHRSAKKPKYQARLRVLTQDPQEKVAALACVDTKKSCLVFTYKSSDIMRWLL